MEEGLDGDWMEGLERGTLAQRLLHAVTRPGALPGGRDFELDWLVRAIDAVLAGAAPETPLSELVPRVVEKYDRFFAET